MIYGIFSFSPAREKEIAIIPEKKRSFLFILHPVASIIKHYIYSSAQPFFVC